MHAIKELVRGILLQDAYWADCRHLNPEPFHWESNTHPGDNPTLAHKEQKVCVWSHC